MDANNSVDIPLDRDALLSAISTLSDNIDDEGNLEKLENYRNVFITRYSTNEEFWKNWIMDTISTKDMTAAIAMFDKAMEYCSTREIVVDYIEYCSRCLDEEKINEIQFRNHMEKAISTAGNDMAWSYLIWKAYLDFEVDEFDDLVEIEADLSEILNAKRRIITLCHRIISVPLSNLEEALRDISDIFERVCVESDFVLIQPETLQRKYETSLENRDARLNFEEFLLSEDFNQQDAAEKMKTWNAYIQYEIQDNNISRVQRLFERSLLVCYSCKDLWSRYIEFAWQTLKNWSLVKSISTRAVVHCFDVPKIWRFRTLSMEISQDSMESIEAVFIQSTQCSFASVDDYMGLITMKGDYFKRQFDKLKDEDRSQLSDLFMKMRQTCQELNTFLDHYYPQWLQGKLAAVKYEINLIRNYMPHVLVLSELQADDIRNNMNEHCNYIFDAFVKQYSKHYSAWKEYLEYNQSMNHVDTDLVRKLYRRALTSVTDDLYSVHKDHLLFEQQFGSVDDIATAWAKYDTYMSNMAIAAAEAASAAITAPTVAVTTTTTNNHEKTAKKNELAKPEKRKRPAEERSSTINSNVSVNGSDVHIEVTQHKKIRLEETKETDSVAMDISNEITRDDAVEEANISTAKSQGPYVIIARNLPFSLTSEDLSEFFAKIARSEKVDENSEDHASNGCIISIVPTLAKTGQSRGMFEVTCSDESIVEKALELNGSDCHGRPIVIERQQPKTGDKKVEEAHHTVFVSKFGEHVSEEGLREVFVKCGEIKAMRLAIDKKTGKSKCNALVQFVNKEGKQAALRLNKTKLMTKDDLGTDNHDLVSIVPSKFEVPQTTQNNSEPQKKNPYLSHGKPSGGSRGGRFF